MRAVVLGVSGLTGRAVASELAGAGWDVIGTGRDERRFPGALHRRGVSFIRSDRRDPVELAAVLDREADLVVDCVAYTAEDARLLLRHHGSFGSAVVLSSKAVYVDDEGRHSNSEHAPVFAAPVAEDQPRLTPDFSGNHDSREGYGANKAAMEQVLMESDVPVSILRASRIHGEGASRPREWFVVRRLLDQRRTIPLAHEGSTGNHPTAAANLARLVFTCANRPGRRVLNAADPGRPTAADVVAAIAGAMGQDIEIVGLPESAPARLGWSPWATWPPFFLDTRAAHRLGYTPVGTYAETVVAAVDALLDLRPEERRALDTDPYFAGRFDYESEDEALQ